MPEPNEKTIISDIMTWGEELDELDHLAFAGKPVSDEKFNQVALELLNGSNWYRYLEKVRTKKQEFVKKIAALEEIEKELEKRIAKQNQVNEIDDVICQQQTPDML